MKKSRFIKDDLQLALMKSQKIEKVSLGKGITNLK
jgi:hypothetical protein